MPKLDEQVLNRLISEVGGAAEAGPSPDLDTPLADHDLDSLACLELTARLERDFGCRLEDNDITAETTRRQILALTDADVRA